MPNELGCDVCSEGIINCELETIASGWFSLNEVVYCPHCGRKLEEDVLQ